MKFILLFNRNADSEVLAYAKKALVVGANTNQLRQKKVQTAESLSVENFVKFLLFSVMPLPMHQQEFFHFLDGKGNQHSLQVPSPTLDLLSGKPLGPRLDLSPIGFWRQ